jgi:hypothetical protein
MKTMGEKLEKAESEQSRINRDLLLVKSRLKENPEDKGLLNCLKQAKLAMIKIEKKIKKLDGGINPCRGCELESQGDIDPDCVDCNFFAYVMGVEEI